MRTDIMPENDPFNFFISFYPSIFLQTLRVAPPQVPPFRCRGTAQRRGCRSGEAAGAVVEPCEDVQHGVLLSFQGPCTFQVNAMQGCHELVCLLQEQSGILIQNTCTNYIQ